MDGLSRLIPKYQEPFEDTVIATLQSEGELRTFVCNSIRELPVMLEQIKQVAFRNKYINNIKVNILQRNQQMTDVFSTRDNVLLYRERVMIPSTLQKRILKDFHAGHPRITRMKSLMCNFVYRPNMDKDTDNTVKLYKGCALAAKAPPVKFNPWPETDLPWSRIHLDFASSLEGYYNLIVVDIFSRWPEVQCINPTSEIVMKFL